MKRIIFLFAIIAIVAALIVGGYLLRQTTGEPSESSSSTDLGTGQLPIPIIPNNASSTGTSTIPTLPTSGFGIADESPVFNYFAAENGIIITISPNGEIRERSGSTTKTLSSTVIKNIRETSFSFDGKKLLVMFGEVDNPQVSVFDTENYEWQPLTISPSSIDWSPTDYQIAYLTEDTDGTAILRILDTEIADPKPKTISSLGGLDLQLSWVTPNEIVISEKSSAFVKNSIWKLNKTTGNLTNVVSEKQGLLANWDKEQNLGILFFSSENRRGGQLSLINIGGKILGEFSFLTLPNKCSFSSIVKTSTSTDNPEEKVFLNCAVPKETQSFSNRILPDDYFKQLIFTDDNLYQIDIQNGNVNALSNNSGSIFDATNIQATNGRLFFINRLDQKLYSITL